MKFKNVIDELQKWVDKGCFNDVWYYIKDFSNFNLLFILQDLDFINFELPVYEIDNQANYLIGTLNNEGFRDYYGHKHPIGMKDVIKGYPQKYHDKNPTYEWILNKSVLNTDLYFSRKIEETIWYMIKNHPDFDNSIELFKDEVAGIEVDTEYYLSFVSETIDEDGKSIYHDFFGFDCDEYDIRIDLLSNLIDEDIINEVNQIINEADNLAAQINSFSQYIIDRLRGFENDLFDNNLSDSQLHNYHRVIEEMSNEIYQYIHPKIIEKFKNHSGDEIFKDTYHYSKKELNSRNSFLKKVLNPNINMKIDSLLKLLYLLNILIDENINKNKSIINLQSKELIRKNIHVVENSEKNSIFRDTFVHTLKPLNEKQIKKSIYSFRAIIIFLNQLFNNMKTSD